jgi:hypothetical protein
MPFHIEDVVEFSSGEKEIVMMEWLNRIWVPPRFLNGQRTNKLSTGYVMNWDSSLGEYIRVSEPHTG